MQQVPLALPLGNMENSYKVSGKQQLPSPGSTLLQSKELPIQTHARSLTPAPEIHSESGPVT